LVEFSQGVSNRVPIEYINYTLCKTFGWTYKELMEQPSDFVEEMIDIINIDNKIKNGRRS
jgi:hypothetical protein